MIWPTDDIGIVSLVLDHEGGYINRSDDMGGSTNFGITIDTLASWRKSLVTDLDMQRLPAIEASSIYLTKYIIGPGFDNISDVKLRACLVDMAVLFGPHCAISALQSILGLMSDGILGPHTLAACSLTDTRPIRNKLSAFRVNYHADVVSKHPDQLPFLKGWLVRALSFIE